MIFSDFFQKIGKQWQNNPAESPEYQAGAMAMLAEIETALATTTLYNLGLQLAETRQELELISSKYANLQNHCKRVDAENNRVSKAKIGRASFATQILSIIKNNNYASAAKKVEAIKQKVEHAAGSFNMLEAQT
jgi:hypothetical protein